MILFPYKKVVIETEMSERSIIFELKLNTENIKIYIFYDKAFISKIIDEDITLRVSEIINDSEGTRPITVLKINIIDKGNFREIEVIFRPSKLSIILNFLMLTLFTYASYHLFKNNYVMTQTIITTIFVSAYVQKLRDFNFDVKKALNDLKTIF